MEATFVASSRKKRGRRLLRFMIPDIYEPAEGHCRPAAYRKAFDPSGTGRWQLAEIGRIGGLRDRRHSSRQFSDWALVMKRSFRGGGARGDLCCPPETPPDPLFEKEGEMGREGMVR
jgi:hypothetical protein